ncbi:LAFA_0E10154g1_1 [Lachancea sp. 'fantastica']|nr:LAFA_0E10154g1_1 [Lachancea sp. 'fantastica']
MYIVDVRLKSSMFEIMREASQELVRHCGGSCHPTVSTLLTRAIENKLRKMTLDHAGSSEIYVTSEDLVLEGQGSIEINATPTQAQKSIVRSLMKVVLHQMDNGIHILTEGQENLLVSLCVESLQVEVSIPDTVFRKSQMTIEEEVAQIFNPSSSDGLQDSEEVRRDYYIKCYRCVKCGELGLESRQIAEDFDKIDIQEPSTVNSDDESTLVCIHPMLPNVSISAETMTQTRVQLLPSSEFEGLWESLHFEDSKLKQNLLGYATISLKLSHFSQRKLSDTLVSNNKLLLVHGPPGTGKTTVCKALCQKLAIRHSGVTQNIFEASESQAIFIELSCSRVFSRWFGESAKNLDRIFQDVENILMNRSNEDRFVCLLIDEVETLASSRSSSMNKNETTDCVRVVNTLLTRLDGLKQYNNLLILATSNLVTALDPAFLDRADGVFYVGKPSEIGTSKILYSTIRELVKNRVVISNLSDTAALNSAEEIRSSIHQIARQCVTSGVSGRTLRKLPLICLSEHLSSLPVPIRDFLLALALTVRRISTLPNQEPI